MERGCFGMAEVPKAGYTSLICSILGFHTITELASDYEKF